MSDSEHDDDRTARLDGELWAATSNKRKKFAQRHLKQLTQLLTTYADGDAEFLLRSLRELFWSQR